MSRPTATGLRKKDTYEKMIDYLDHGQEKIKYPNRYFRQLRDSPWLTQLEGDDLNDMDAQQLKESKIIQQQVIIREVAQASGTSAQEVRTTNNNTTNNYSTTNNTTNNHRNPGGGGPDVNMSTSTSEAGVQSERPGNIVMGTQTDPHPLKHSTGTGTDYTPSPDSHTHQPPPASGQSPQTVHMSTTRKLYQGNAEELSAPVFHQGSGASSSFGLPPGPEAPAKVNPQMDKRPRGPPSSERVPVQHKPMDVDERAMSWQQQENARKEFEAQQKREKSNVITTHARDSLADNALKQLKSRQPIKEATMAQQNVLRPFMEARNRARSENVKDKRYKAEEIPQVQAQSQKTAKNTDDVEYIKPPRSKTRSKPKKEAKEEDIPQVVKQKAIRDRTESRPTPQLKVPPKRLSIKDRSSSPQIPQASKARSRSRGRSHNPDKEEINGPSKAELRQAAFPRAKVSKALAEHNISTYEKTAEILTQMHAEHSDKKQKVSKGISKTTKAKAPRPRAIRTSNKSLPLNRLTYTINLMDFP